MKYASIIISSLFLLASGVSVHAQRWTTQTIREAGFSVSVPGEMIGVPEFTGEDGLVMEPTRRHRFETFYAVVDTSGDIHRFGVAVVEGRLRTALIESGTMDDYYNYLGRIFLGDPAEALYFKRSTPVVKNGLKGFDHLYIRAHDPEKPLRYTHGRLFDNGRKSYVVIYRAQFEHELQSDEALKFLNSFRLSPAPRPARRRARTEH